MIVFYVDIMKILQVIQFFGLKHGGSFAVAYEITKYLARHGYEITVITTDFEFDRNLAESLKGVEVIPFHCQYNIGGFLLSTSMNKYLQENINKFDIIHMHNFRTYQNIIVRKYAKKYNVPYILQAHGNVMPFFSKEKLKRSFDAVWGFKILENSSKVISLTKTETDQYKKMSVNENRIEIVPNGINLSEYENLPNKGTFRKKFGIKNDEKIVLYLGRIHRIKGIDLLIEAFSELLHNVDEIKLVIAGPDDGFLSTLKIQIDKLKIGENILFTGPLYKEDKIEAYVDADIFVLPSVYETFPVTILEAFACNTPVITTDRCGIADQIDGIVIKYDRNQLSKAMLDLLTDSETRVKFGNKGRELVTKKFDWNVIVPHVEAVYNNCIDTQFH